MPAVSTPLGTMYVRPEQERIYVQVASDNLIYDDDNWVKTRVFDHEFPNRSHPNWPVNRMHFRSNGGGIREVEGEDA